MMKRGSRLSLAEKQKRTKEKYRNKKRDAQGGKVHHLYETSNLEGGVSRSCSRYNLRKGAPLSKV
jgi:hypothetical protein